MKMLVGTDSSNVQLNSSISDEQVANKDLEQMPPQKAYRVQSKLQ